MHQGARGCAAAQQHWPAQRRPFQQRTQQRQGSRGVLRRASPAQGRSTYTPAATRRRRAWAAAMTPAGCAFLLPLSWKTHLQTYVHISHTQPVLHNKELESGALTFTGPVESGHARAVPDQAMCVSAAYTGGGSGGHGRVQSAGLPEAPRGLAAARARQGCCQQVGCAVQLPQPLRSVHCAAVGGVCCRICWTDPLLSLLHWIVRAFARYCVLLHRLVLRPVAACGDKWSNCTLYMYHACVHYLVHREKFPLFFSQDGTPPHEATRALAQSYDEVRNPT